LIYFKCELCGQVDDFVLNNYSVIVTEKNGQTVLCTDCSKDLDNWLSHPSFVYSNSYYDRAGDDEEARED
jgi:hypothetical protein